MKITTLFAIFAMFCMVSFSSAQSTPWYKGISFGAPHGHKKPMSEPGKLGSIQYSVTNDSLLKGVVFFDGISNGTPSVDYTLFTLNGLLPNGINFGDAFCYAGSTQEWDGPSISYDVVQNANLTLGLAVAWPGLMVNDGVVSLAHANHIYPGLIFSYKF